MAHDFTLLYSENSTFRILLGRRRHYGNGIQLHPFLRYFADRRKFPCSTKEMSKGMQRHADEHEPAPKHIKMTDYGESGVHKEHLKAALGDFVKKVKVEKLKRV